MTAVAWRLENNLLDRQAALIWSCASLYPVSKLSLRITMIPVLNKRTALRNWHHDWQKPKQPMPRVFVDAAHFALLVFNSKLKLATKPQKDTRKGQ